MHKLHSAKNNKKTFQIFTFNKFRKLMQKMNTNAK